MALHTTEMETFLSATVYVVLGVVNHYSPTQWSHYLLPILSQQLPQLTNMLKAQLSEENWNIEHRKCSRYKMDKLRIYLVYGALSVLTCYTNIVPKRGLRLENMPWNMVWQLLLKVFKKIVFN